MLDELERRRPIAELVAWRQLSDRVTDLGDPIFIPASWPRNVARIAELLNGFAAGMTELDLLRPECPTCHGDTDFDCPENDYDCDGKMSFERMQAWCLYVINLPSGPLTRDELWDIR